MVNSTTATAETARRSAPTRGQAAMATTSSHSAAADHHTVPAGKAEPTAHSNSGHDRGGGCHDAGGHEEPARRDAADQHRGGTEDHRDDHDHDG